MLLNASEFEANDFTYEVEVSLEGAELFRSEVFWEDNIRKCCGVVNSKGFSRGGPANHSWMGRRSFAEFSFAIEHLIESARELLRDAAFSCSRKCKRREGAGSLRHG